MSLLLAPAAGEQQKEVAVGGEGALACQEWTGYELGALAQLEGVVVVLGAGDAGDGLGKVRGEQRLRLVDSSSGDVAVGLGVEVVAVDVRGPALGHDLVDLERRWWGAWPAL